MKRRQLMGLAGLVLPAGLAVSRTARAGDPCEVNTASRLAGGVYLTRQAPGRFPEKADGHSPIITTRRVDGDVLEVGVATSHEMNGYEHYIVKHMLLNWAFEVMDEHLFDPTRDRVPVSRFTVENYGGPLYALSMCNKHDVWLDGVLV